MKNIILYILLLSSCSIFAQTIPASATAVVESGNLSFVIRNDGSLFHQNGEMGQLTGVKNAEGETPALLDFTGIWIGSFQEEQYKTSIADNRNINNTHFAPGPSYSPTGTLSLDKQEIFNQIWKVTDDEIVAHIADFVWDGKVDTIRENVYQWPGFGNKHFQEYFEGTEEHETEERYLVHAPFFDLNFNEKYEPHLGEYPYANSHNWNGTKRATQMYYTVFNDYNNDNSPMQINIHQTVSTYECDSPSLLNNTIFVDLEYVNKSAVSIDSLYIGWFVDSGLSCSEKNFAGTDTLTKALYFYNGKDYDSSIADTECEQEDFPFIEDSPVVSLISFDRNWSSTAYYNAVPSSSPDALNPPEENPIEYYGYLTGYWRDGTPLSYGNHGYGGNQPISYIFPGNPDTQEGWIMQSDSLHAGVSERYFLASAQNKVFVNADIDWIPNIIQSLPAEWHGKLSFAFHVQQNDSENTLTNAQLARDSLSLWHYLSGFGNWDGEPYISDCFLPHPQAPVPKEPIVSLYPNPAHDFITIRLPQKDMKYIRVYNVSGQLLLEKSIKHDFISLTEFPELILDTELDISTLPTGFYAIEIEGVHKNIQIHKFLKM